LSADITGAARSVARAEKGVVRSTIGERLEGNHTAMSVAV
jgi:hypothetical protein